MLKKRIILSAIFAIALFTLSSCGDDSSSPAQTDKKMTEYFPLTVGSWWLYAEYETDSLRKRISEPTYDTVKVIGMETILGKTAYIVTNNTLDEEGALYIDTTIYSVDESAIYILRDSTFSYGNVSEREWFPFFKLGKSQWVIVDDTFIDDEDTVVYKTTVSAVGKPSNSSSIQLKGSSVTGKGFLITTHIKATMSDSVNTDFPIMDSKSETETWLAPGVGPIHSFGKTDIFFVSYFESILIDYFIK